MPKRTTITIPNDLLGACIAWQEEQWAIHRYRASYADALVGLARRGAEATGLLEAPAKKPKKD